MFYGSQPLAKYSEDLERASFFDEPNTTDQDLASEDSMPRKGSKSRKGKKVKTTRGLKFSTGRVVLRIPGYGLQKLAPADLIRFIPILKLRLAGKKVLRSKGIPRIKSKSKRKGSRKRQTL
jgi:hypothetical protein